MDMRPHESAALMFFGLILAAGAYFGAAAEAEGAQAAPSRCMADAAVVVCDATCLERYGKLKKFSCI